MSFLYEIQGARADWVKISQKSPKYIKFINIFLKVHILCHSIAQIQFPICEEVWVLVKIISKVEPNKVE